VGGLVGYLIYGPVLGGFFISDDFVWLEVAGRVLTDPVHLLDRDVGGFVRPGAHMLNALVLAGWGARAPAFHAAALVLHALNMALLAALVWTLSGRRWTGVVAALIFALLPAYQEALVWISALNEPLHALFALACLLGWQAHLRRRSRGGLAMAAAGLMGAMATKATALALPPLMLLCQIWLRRQGRSARATPLMLAFIVAPALVFVAFQAWLYRQNGLAATGQLIIEPALIVRMARMAGDLLLQTWPVWPAALVGLLWPRPAGKRQAATAAAALLLALALALTLAPYAPITWAPRASRFFYFPALVVATLGAGGITLAVESRALLPRLLALLSLCALALLNTNTPDQALARYRADAARTRRHIAAARRLPAPDPSVAIHILDCPLPAQHLSAAMAVFHPSRSRDYYCVTRRELLALRGPRWVWRWLPRFEKFALLERRTSAR